MTTAIFIGIEKTLQANLSKTENNLLIAVAWFTNPSLFSALYDLATKGKNITLIMSDDEMNFTNRTFSFQNLIDRGVEIRISRHPNLMHHKFCVIDNRILITGSYNWTLKAEKFNHENIIVSTELKLITQFLSAYEFLKKNTERVSIVSVTSFSSYSSKGEIDKELELAAESLSNQHSFIDTLYTETTSEINKEGATAMYEKANSYYLKGRYREAVNICNQIIMTNSSIADVYELLATIHWRQGNYKDQITYAAKAIELDNQFYSAYNTLAIGYASIGNDIQSIENYRICIEAEPKEYTYYKNRALSYIELENIVSDSRNKFTENANKDLEKTIQLADECEPHDKRYTLYYDRGVAYYFLGKYIQARTNLLKARRIYEVTDQREQDSHHVKEIKSYLNNINKILK